jgi:hypothetical protein
VRVVIGTIDRAGWPVYHRGPCCTCSICGSRECIVFNNDEPVTVELRAHDCGCVMAIRNTNDIHVCAFGCDGPDWKTALFAEHEGAA